MLKYFIRLVKIIFVSNQYVILFSDARVRSLAAAWARSDHDFAESLLFNKDLFGLVEVLKAITLLDSARRIRVHEKKMKQIQMTGKPKAKKIGFIKSNIDSLNTLKPQVIIRFSCNTLFHRTQFLC